MSLWFLVPAHGRLDLTWQCLRVLRHTCDTLTEAGIHATAVVVADDENLDAAAELGFATVEQTNAPLGRKWNDAYEYACRYGEAEYVVPFGSDDWVDPQLILTAPLPADGEITSFHRSAVVSEDGRRIAPLHIAHPLVGGDGVRIIPNQLLESLRYRPAEEHAARAIDTSVMRRLSRERPPRLVFHDLHAFQIVDWKSDTTQLNSYRDCLAHMNGDEQSVRPALEPHYPAWALDAMDRLHTERLVAA